MARVGNIGPNSQPLSPFSMKFRGRNDVKNRKIIWSETVADG
jgi:hypothetical protein